MDYDLRKKFDEIRDIFFSLPRADRRADKKWDGRIFEPRNAYTRICVAIFATYICIGENGYKYDVDYEEDYERHKFVDGYLRIYAKTEYASRTFFVFPFNVDKRSYFNKAFSAKSLVEKMNEIKDSIFDSEFIERKSPFYVFPVNTIILEGKPRDEYKPATSDTEALAAFEFIPEICDELDKLEYADLSVKDLDLYNYLDNVMTRVSNYFMKIKEKKSL